MDRRFRAVPLFAVVALVALAHAPSLRNTFHYDDTHSILRNPHLRDLRSLPRFFTDPRTYSAEPAYAMYRPVVVLTLALNHAVGGYNPRGYLLANLGIHCAVASVAFLLLRHLLGSGPAPFLAALLLALHPVQTEAVSYVSSRSESLAALFCLVSVAAYRRAGPADRRWYSASLATYALGLLSKTTALALPLLLLAHDGALVRDPRSRATALRRHLPFWLLSIAYLLVYQALMPGTLTDSGQVRALSAQLATQVKALVHYGLRCVAPVHLSVYPQFGESLSVLESAPLMAALASGSVVYLAVRHGPPALRLGTLWFGACLLPTVLIPLHILVNDHRVYLALFGFCLAVGSLQASCRRRWPLFAACAILGVLAWQRHGVWRDEVALWQDAAEQGPSVPEAQYNLGRALQEVGQREAARAAYERAVGLSPGYVRAQVNLGAVYREEGRYDRAESALRRALQADPASVEALNNLGLVRFGQRSLGEAISLFRRALAVDAARAEVWLNLGLALRDAGARQEAAEALARAVRLDPTLKERYPAPAR